MNEVIEYVRRYQAYDPDTGEFTARRSITEYAELLGVDQTNLSRFYRAQRRRPWRIVVGLLKAFPETAPEVSRILRDLDRPGGVLEVPEEALFHGAGRHSIDPAPDERP
jgi:hypothetical protein